MHELDIVYLCVECKRKIGLYHWWKTEDALDKICAVCASDQDVGKTTEHYFAIAKKNYESLPYGLVSDMTKGEEDVSSGQAQ